MKNINYENVIYTLNARTNAMTYYLFQAKAM